MTKLLNEIFKLETINYPSDADIKDDLDEADRIIMLKQLALIYFSEKNDPHQYTDHYLRTPNKELDGLTPMKAVNNPKYGIHRAASLIWLATPQ
jgi:hypothetical protein